jgi:ASC-1-like (ASCH) protein/ligand-binding SRPBCC domain-containing protein
MYDHFLISPLVPGFALTVLLLGATLMIQTVYAQTDNDVATSEQTTLSKDLTNNPVAQDILKKIEQTKKWIKELEDRKYEELQAKVELEAKRTQALEKLNQDLKEWESLWEYYSPRNSFSRFVDTVQDTPVKDVFWDQFEFHQMKVDAGRQALKTVIANGGSLSEARQAYHIAAETKRIELIEANSIFNVNHNLAYYNQQILFNKEGQFIETPITGEQLRKYYEDYRTNPAYLKANPNDVVSWEDLGKTTPDTECRKGSVVVYRYHANDYVCVSMFTAEMWIRHGMGEITGSSTSQSKENSVTPLTKCDEGFTVVYALESGKYSCVLQETAESWITQGIAEQHDPQSYILDKIQDKDVSVTIIEVNQKIQGFYDELALKQAELKEQFDKKYDDALLQSKLDEKRAIKDQSERVNMSKEELSNKIIQIRKHYDSTKDNTMQEKIDALKSLDKTYNENLKKFAQTYDLDPYVKIVWNSDYSKYEAVKKN